MTRALLAFALASCTVDAPLSLGAQCELNSDCSGLYVCRLSRCRVACVATADCDLGVTCVLDNRELGACLLVEEERCSLSSDCPGDLECRMGRCRNACATDEDCVEGAHCIAVDGLPTCVDESEERCLADEDCSDDDRVCGPFQTCIDQCNEVRDCAAGLSCIDHVCTLATGPCTRDEECTDGLFCNGLERCDSSDPGADLRGCAPASPACAVDEVCVEERDACEDRCDTMPDADLDGQDAVACGGTDCNDADALIFEDAAERCNEADDDCDTRTDEGFDLDIDPEHCGSCDRSCREGGLDGSCVGGDCTFECAAGFADCDRDPATGCEVDTRVDPLHCGGCMDPCSAGDGCTGSICDEAPIVEVAAGDGFTCGRRATGGVFCVGANDQGQLGDGTTTDRLVPVHVIGVRDATAIVAGASHACALLETGAIVCWGDNALGQLGDDTTAARANALAIHGPSDAVAIAAGRAHTCLLRSGGDVACWGDNAAGQIASAAAFEPHATRVVLPAMASLAAGADGSCAIDAGGDVTCWGAFYPSGDDMPRRVTVADDLRGFALGAQASGAWWSAIDAAGALRAWGTNTSGVLGGAAPATTPAIVPELSSIAMAQVAAGTGPGGPFTCARSTSGDVYCTGSDADGALGDGGSLPGSTRASFAEVTAASAVDLAAGAGHACIATMSGTMECWGRGDRGQLANGSTMSASSPVAAMGVP
jgi:alpha-tubulin suppressor-like RCC1 family protein